MPRRRKPEPIDTTDSTVAFEKATNPKVQKALAQQEKARKDAQQKQKEQQDNKNDDGGWLDFAANVVNPVRGPIEAAKDILTGKETPVSGVAKGATAGTVAAAPPVKEPVEQAAGEAAQQTWDNTFGRIPGFESTVRWGMAGLQLPLQAVQGSIRREAQEISNEGLQAFNPFYEFPKQVGLQDVGGLRSAWEQTTAGQALARKIGEGKDSGLGGGLFGSPDAPAGKAQAEAARKYSPNLIGGHAWTPGRALANVVTEPGTTPFKLMSGTSDAVLALIEDPLIVGGKARVAAKAAKEGVRPTSTLQSLAENFATPGGKQVEKGLVEGRTADEILAKNPSLRQATAERLANATDAKTVRGILATEASTSERVSLAQRAGAANGFRHFVIPNNVEGQMASPGWARLEDELRAAATGEGGATEDLARFRQILNKAPAQTVHGDNFYLKLREAANSENWRDAIKNVYRDQLEIQGQVPKASGLGYRYRRLANGSTPVGRKLGLIPEQVGDPSDVDNFAEFLSRHGQNGKLTLSERNRILTRYLEDPTRETGYQQTRLMDDIIRRNLINEHGVDPERAANVTRMFQKEDDVIRHYMINRVADSDGTYINGLAYPDGRFINFDDHPFDINQLLNTRVRGPDWRAVRREMSFWKPILDNGFVEGSNVLLTKFMNVWRGVKIARPALALRVLAEQQMAAAARGLAAFPSHPIQAAAWVIGNAVPDSALANKLDDIFGGAMKAEQLGLEQESIRSQIGRQIGAEGPQVAAEAAPAVKGKTLAGVIRRIEQRVGRGAVEPGGGLFETPKEARLGLIDPDSEDRWTNALRDGWANVNGPQNHRMMAVGEFQVVRPDHPAAARGLVEELNFFSNPVAKKVLDSPIDDAAEWFWTGGGRNIRNELAKTEHLRPLAEDRAFSDAYITGYRDQMQQLAGGDQRLLDAIKTRKIDGNPLMLNARPNKPAVESVQGLLDQGVGPQRIKVANEYLMSTGELERQSQRLNEHMSQLFGLLLPVPEQFWSRSPVLRQLTWDEADRLAPLLKPSEAGQLIANAERAKLPSKVLESIRGKVGTAVAENEPRALSLDQLNLVARAKAADRAPQVLDMMHQRGQLWDVMRNVVPFGTPWVQQISRWGRIAMDNPAFFEKARLAVEGARDTGFVRTDPGTQQETFILPGTEWVNEKAAGIPIPLQAPLSGLSLMGEGLPGIGPAAQIPLDVLTRDTPVEDDIDKLLFPFGRPEQKTGDPYLDVMDAVNPLPSFTHRFFTAFSDPTRQRDYGNTINWVMRYNLSTGKYSTATPQELDRLYSDSKDEAKRLLIMRGLIQSTSPSAPFPKWMVKDKDGKMKEGTRLIDEWRKLSTDSKLTYDEAFNKFTQKHGMANVLLTQAFSEPVKGFSPLTDEAAQWSAANPEIRRRYPDVYGLFAPSKGKFSLDVWQKQLNYGDRHALSPQEFLQRANDRTGAFLYRQERDRMRQSPEEAFLDRGRSKLTALKDYLAELYPGYEPDRFDIGKNPGLIRQLSLAVVDDSVKKAAPQMTKAISTYLSERKKALDEAEGGSLAGRDDDHLRARLRGLGERLSRKNRGFARVFDSVFDFEVR